MAMQSMWSKKVLIPIWIIQIACLLVEFGLCVSSLVAVRQIEEEDEVVAGGYSSLLEDYGVAARVTMSVAVVSLSYNIIEVINFARHILKPLLVVVISCIRTIIWGFLGALAIIDVVRGVASIGSIFILILLLTSLAMLIYSSVIYHRQRRATSYRGTYAPADVRGFGLAPSGSYTAYNPGNESLREPLREPSPAPSTTSSATQPKVAHPAFRHSSLLEQQYGGPESFEMNPQTPPVYRYA